MGSAQGVGHHRSCSGQWADSFPGEGLGEADAVAGGLADVRVVEQPVDGGGGEGLGHQFVERGRVQVRADRDAAFSVGGIDEPVEAFGGVLGHGQQADVVNLCGNPHSLTYADTAIMPRCLRPGHEGLVASGLLPFRLRHRVGIVRT